jgi:peptidoglycan/LPS O-acetylase OafA/YrhL
VCFHLTFAVWASKNSGAKSLISDGYSFLEIYPFTWFGWVGVEIFFVISGYVVANSSNGRSALYFIRSRISRLYPAVWVCSTITVVILLYSGMYEFSEIFTRYIHSIILIPIHPWVDPVYWTLAVEISFYFIFLCLLLFKKMRLLRLVVIVLVLLTTCYQVPLLVNNIYYITDIKVLPLQVSRLFMMDFGAFFALGILMWMSDSGVKKNKLLMGFTFITCFIEIINHTFYVYDAMPILHNNSVFSFFIPSFIWTISCALIFWGNKVNFIFEKMGQKTILITRVLGLITFPLYLIHFILGVFIIELLFTSFNFNIYLALCFSLLFTLFLSYAVSVYLEPIIRNTLNIKFDKFITYLEKHLSLTLFKSTDKYL